MKLSPDSPSIIAISIAAGVFAAIGIGVIFAPVGTPAASRVPDVVAQEPKPAAPIAAPSGAPAAAYGRAESNVITEVIKMERWWESTHRQHAQRNTTERQAAAKHGKPNVRLAEESREIKPGTRLPATDSPKYLGDTSRWPLHGPGLDHTP